MFEKIASIVYLIFLFFIIWNVVVLCYYKLRNNSKRKIRECGHSKVVYDSDAMLECINLCVERREAVFGNVVDGKFIETEKE